METKSNKLGFETYRADISNIGTDTERTFDVVFATENPIRLQGWKYSNECEEFDEILRCDRKNVRTKRMDVGLPIFPDHWKRSSTDLLGITTSYSFEQGKIAATVKLGARADEQLWSDIKNGILRTVSVGCNIYKVERMENSEMNITLTYTATDWEPKHIAFAPEPADIDATMRSEHIEIVNKSTSKVETKDDSFLANILNLK